MNILETSSSPVLFKSNQIDRATLKLLERERILQYLRHILSRKEKYFNGHSKNKHKTTHLHFGKNPLPLHANTECTGAQPFPLQKKFLRMSTGARVSARHRQETVNGLCIFKQDFGVELCGPCATEKNTESPHAPYKTDTNKKKTFCNFF